MVKMRAIIYFIGLPQRQKQITIISGDLNLIIQPCLLEINNPLQ